MIAGTVQSVHWPLSATYGIRAALAGLGLSLLIGVPASAADDFKVDPERQALLIEIIEDLGCEVDGVSPPPEFLTAMALNAFVKDVTKAIAAQMINEGIAVRNGPNLILKTENCT